MSVQLWYMVFDDGAKWKASSLPLEPRIRIGIKMCTQSFNRTEHLTCKTNFGPDLFIFLKSSERNLDGIQFLVSHQCAEERGIWAVYGPGTRRQS